MKQFFAIIVVVLLVAGLVVFLFLQSHNRTVPPPASAPARGPDFSSIDSKEKAEDLARSGKLEKLLLRPIGFGGQDEPRNCLYVPIGTAASKASIDNIIKSLCDSGNVTEYSAKPEYQGKSFIPIAIHIVGSGPGHPALFHSVINIWGDALTRNQDTEH